MYTILKENINDFTFCFDKVENDEASLQKSVLFDCKCRSKGLSVCMNVYISATVRAKDTKFDKKIPTY